MPYRVPSRRTGFTMIEVFSVLMLIAVLIMILLPAVQSAREAARRASCANNLMQIGLGVRVYHNAFDQFPVQLSGTDGSKTPGQDNDRRLSFLVAILPFVDRQNLYAEIHSAAPRQIDEFAYDDIGMMMAEDFEDMAESTEAESEPWVVGGPEPFVAEYHPWRFEVSTYRCPSDPGYGGNPFGRVNYVGCLGDAVLASASGPLKEDAGGVFVLDAELAKQTEAAMRGIFVPRSVTRLADVSDGLSHTILLGEIATDLGDRSVRTHPAPGPGSATLRDNPNWAQEQALIDFERPEFWMTSMTGGKLENNGGMRRGLRWADGMPLYTGFNTILPPNRELVLSEDRDDCWGILPPSSRHQGGAQICFADGSIRFITDSIDAGNASAPTVYVGSANAPGSESPYGLWGALGTRASGEIRMFQTKPDRG